VATNPGGSCTTGGDPGKCLGQECCLLLPGSPTPTPTVDEDCDGNLDNTVVSREWVVTSSTPFTTNDNGCAFNTLGTVGDTCSTLGCPTMRCGVDASGGIFTVCSGEGHGSKYFAGGDASCEDVTLYY
jgi:hypothetical protein